MVWPILHAKRIPAKGLIEKPERYAPPMNKSIKCEQKYDNQKGNSFAYRLLEIR